jgi:hypothetical protein
MNHDRRVRMQIAYKIDRFLPHPRSRLAEGVQNFDQHIFSRHQLASCKRTARLLGSLVPSILPITDGAPVERIDEDPLHVAGRFGVPYR